MPVLNDHDNDIMGVYIKARRIALMDGHEHITPSSLVTFFQLYPRYDMDTQMRLSDVLLEMSLTHKNLVEEIRVEKEKAAAEVEARKSAAEDVKSRTVQGQTG